MDSYTLLYSLMYIYMPTGYVFLYKDSIDFRFDFLVLFLVNTNLYDYRHRCVFNMIA